VFTGDRWRRPPAPLSSDLGPLKLFVKSASRVHIAVKISFVLPRVNLSGGMRVLAIYAEALHRRGHEVLVVSQPAGGAGWKQKLARLVREGSARAAARDRSHFDGLTVPHVVLERQRPVDERDLPGADVVVATWWETAEWVAELPASKGAKVHFVQHHELLWYEPGTSSYERAAAVYKLPFHHITISRWLQRLLRDDYGHADVAVVPNGVDVAQFYAPPRGKQPVPTVGMLYSPLPIKGCALGTRAVEIARQRLPELRFLAFGSVGPSRKIPLPTSTSYSLRPPQARIRGIYGSCDAWLFTSVREGFGLPILEAMACRTPVIATPAGIAPEVLENGGGILVRPNDPEDMAHSILQFATMPEDEWKRLSDRALADAQTYSWERATNAFERSLEETHQKRGRE